MSCCLPVFKKLSCKQGSEAMAAVVLKAWDDYDWDGSSDALTDWLNTRWKKTGYKLSNEAVCFTLRLHFRDARMGIRDAMGAREPTLEGYDDQIAIESCPEATEGHIEHKSIVVTWRVISRQSCRFKPLTKHTTMIITIPVLLSMAAMALADCSNVSSDLEKAINIFCYKTDNNGHFTNDIVIPSNYASKGHREGKFTVAIGGHCNPGQWVPSDVCKSQFHELCAGGANTAVGFQGWKGAPNGQNMCQTWYYFKNK